jgi:hypothetical protein
MRKTPPHIKNFFCQIFFSFQSKSLERIKRIKSWWYFNLHIPPTFVYSFWQAIVQPFSRFVQNFALVCKSVIFHAPSTIQLLNFEFDVKVLNLLFSLLCLKPAPLSCFIHLFEIQKGCWGVQNMTLKKKM